MSANSTKKLIVVVGAKRISEKLISLIETGGSEVDFRHHDRLAEVGAPLRARTAAVVVVNSAANVRKLAKEAREAGVPVFESKAGAATTYRALAERGLVAQPVIVPSTREASIVLVADQLEPSELGEVSDVLLKIKGRVVFRVRTDRATNKVFVSKPDGSFASEDEFEALMRQNVNPPLIIVVSDRTWEVTRNAVKKDAKDMGDAYFATTLADLLSGKSTEKFRKRIQAEATVRVVEAPQVAQPKKEKPRVEWFTEPDTGKTYKRVGDEVFCAHGVTRKDADAGGCARCRRDDEVRQAAEQEREALAESEVAEVPGNFACPHDKVKEDCDVCMERGVWAGISEAEARGDLAPEKVAQAAASEGGGMLYCGHAVPLTDFCLSCEQEARAMDDFFVPGAKVTIEKPSSGVERVTAHQPPIESDEDDVAALKKQRVRILAKEIQSLLKQAGIERITVEESEVSVEMKREKW